MTVDRVFRAVDRFGAAMEFELRHPNLAVENEGERQYRIAYNKAIADGIYPRNRLREAMKQHQMWTDEDDLAMKTVIAQIAIHQVELEQNQSAGNHEKCLEIATEMRKNRVRMWELFMIQQSVYLNAAEGLAELVKAETIMAACTMIKATGERYWKNYTEFVRERDENQSSTVYSKVVEVQNNVLNAIRTEFEAEYAESKYLKDVKTMILDREIEEKVDEEIQKRAAKARENAGLENSVSQTG